MCGILIIVLGIIYLIRRFKLAKLRPEWFPDLPAEEFDRWKRYEMLSIDIFLVATIGVGTVGLIIGIALAVIGAGHPAPQQQGVIDTLAIGVTIAQISLFVIGILVSAV